MELRGCRGVHTALQVGELASLCDLQTKPEEVMPCLAPTSKLNGCEGPAAMASPKLTRAVTSGEGAGCSSGQLEP